MELVMGGLFGFATYQAIMQALPTCEAVDPKTHDWTTFNQVGKALKTNGKSMLMENAVALEQVVESTVAGEIMTAGFQLGNTLKAASKSETFLY